MSDSTVLEYETINYTVTADNESDMGDNKFTINSMVVNPEGFTRTVYIYFRSTLDGKYVKFDEMTNKYVALDEDETSDTVVLNGNDSTPIVLTKLAAPSGLTLAGNDLTWNRVSRASGYQLKIVCTSDDTVETQFYEIYGTRYNISLNEVGAYDIFVCAMGNDNVILTSNYSNPVRVIKLPPVTDLTVDVDGSGATMLNWQPATFRFNDVDYSAKGYEVKLNTHVEYLNEANNILNNSLSLTNMLQYLTTEGTTCSVKALGQNTDINGVVLLDSIECPNITLFKLARPTALIANADSLTWNGVSSAQAYDVYNADTYLGRVETTGFAFTRQSLNLNDPSSDNYYGGAHFEFSVRAVRVDLVREDLPNSYYVPSEESSLLAIDMLATPQVKVDQDSGTASWESDPRAASYLVNVTEGATTYSYAVANIGNTISHTPTVSAPDGANVRISVSAIGDNIDYLNSFAFAYSTDIVKLQPLATDADGNAFTIDVEHDADGKTSFTINIVDKDADPSTLGRGYFVNIGGVDVFTASGQYTVESLAVGEYRIKVCAAGNNYSGEVLDQSESNTLYINSDYSAEQIIYVLAAPNPSQVYVSTGGLGDITKRVVSFKAVEAAKGYKISYTYRKLIAAGSLQEEAQYQDLEGYPQSVTLEVGSDIPGVAFVEDNKVNFVIDGIDGNVDNIIISITVLGDDEGSISSSITSVSYDVR